MCRVRRLLSLIFSYINGRPSNAIVIPSSELLPSTSNYSTSCTSHETLHKTQKKRHQTSPSPLQQWTATLLCFFWLPSPLVSASTNNSITIHCLYICFWKNNSSYSLVKSRSGFFFQSSERNFFFSLNIKLCKAQYARYPKFCST